MRSKAFRFPVALIALVAMLFSAVSPAVAALIFHDRADMLAGLLARTDYTARAMKHATPQVDATVHDAHIAHSTEHSHQADRLPSGEDDDHAAHGIYCSFCLAASSIVALLGAPAMYAAIKLVTAASLSHTTGVVPRHLPLVHAARGPPAF